MPNLLAQAILSATICSSQPIAPHDSSNLAQLYAVDQKIQQLDEQFERVYVPLPAKQFIESLPSAPSTGENLQLLGQPSAITIKPYGHSFMFNGLRVYVEPVAVAQARLVKAPTTRP